MYLHAPIVRTKCIVRLSGYPLIQDSLNPPSGRVPERAPKRFLVATEACGGGTPDLSSSSMFLGYMDLYRRKKSIGGASRGPGDRGRAQGVGAPPLPRALLVDPLTCTQVSWIAFFPKITSPEGFIPFGLRLIFLFFETLKQGKKQELALGSGSIG